MRQVVAIAELVCSGKNCRLMCRMVPPGIACGLHRQRTTEERGAHARETSAGLAARRFATKAWTRAGDDAGSGCPGVAAGSSADGGSDRRGGNRRGNGGPGRSGGRGHRDARPGAAAERGDHRPGGHRPAERRLRGNAGHPRPVAGPDRRPVQGLRGDRGRRPFQRVLLHLDPTTATSGTDGIGTTWQSAVTGNLAVVGTAPALPGTSAATTLITSSVAYAAAGWNSSGDAGTGLYLSLNCDYSTAAANTAVPLLDGVEGISSGNGLTVQGSLSCSDNGTVNGWGAANAKTFSGYTSASLAAARRGRPRPARSRRPSIPGPARPRPGRRGLSRRSPTMAPATPARTLPPLTGPPGSRTSCSAARSSRPRRSRRPPEARYRPTRRPADRTPPCPG